MTLSARTWALTVVGLAVFALGCSKKASPDAELMALRDEMCACETQACSTNVDGRFAEWRAEKEQTMSDGALELIGAYYLCLRENPPYVEREKATDSECKRISRHLAPLLASSSDTREQSDIREWTAKKCEDLWDEKTRACMLEVDSADAVLECRVKAVEVACSEVFSRLQKLVADAKVADPGLKGKRERFEAICRDQVYPSARVCMLEAETLEQFKECDVGGFAPRLLASEALRWSAQPIVGLEAWQVNEGFRGTKNDRQAMKLATNTFERNGRLVQPQIFLSCQGEYLGFHFDSRLLSAREISMPPVGDREVKLQLAIDGRKVETWDGFAVFRSLTGVGEPKKLLAKLQGAKELVWHVSETEAITFQLDNLAEVIAKFETCFQPTAAK